MGGGGLEAESAFAPSDPQEIAKEAFHLVFFPVSTIVQQKIASFEYV